MKNKIKVFEINSVPYGSTGYIMFQIAREIEEIGGIAFTATSYTKKRNIIFPANYFQIGNIFSKYIHIKLSKYTGKQGCYSKRATKKLIQKIKSVSPDIIHLHNLHEGFLNIPEFFKFLKEYDRPIIWTLHDCWAFTGHCTHFTFEKCMKWKTGCYQCPKYKEYPVCNIDNSNDQYQIKKQAFQNISNLTIVTPSEWLKNMIKESYLKEYEVVVINNGIDLNIFKPMKSNFRIQYGLENKFIILGVAFDWGVKKGLEVFKKLSQDLDDSFAVVMVGVRPEIKKYLPNNIIAIECTQDQKELAKIYTVADVFVNPTLEENFPTVNIEALACGVPVITYQTGGSPEIITEQCGVVIPYDNYPKLKNAILDIAINRNLKREDCLKQAQLYKFSSTVNNYISLYDIAYNKKLSKI